MAVVAFRGTCSLTNMLNNLKVGCKQSRHQSRCCCLLPLLLPRLVPLPLCGRAGVTRLGESAGDTGWLHAAHLARQGCVPASRPSLAVLDTPKECVSPAAPPRRSGARRTRRCAAPTGCAGGPWCTGASSRAGRTGSTWRWVGPCEPAGWLPAGWLAGLQGGLAKGWFQRRRLETPRVRSCLAPRPSSAGPPALTSAARPPPPPGHGNAAGHPHRFPAAGRPPPLAPAVHGAQPWRGACQPGGVRRRAAAEHAARGVLRGCKPSALLHLWGPPSGQPR